MSLRINSSSNNNDLTRWFNDLEPCNVWPPFNNNNEELHVYLTDVVWKKIVRIIFEHFNHNYYLHQNGQDFVADRFIVNASRQIEDDLLKDQKISPMRYVCIIGSYPQQQVKKNLFTLIGYVILLKMSYCHYRLCHDKSLVVRYNTGLTLLRHHQLAEAMSSSSSSLSSEQHQSSQYYEAIPYHQIIMDFDVSQQINETFHANDDGGIEMYNKRSLFIKELESFVKKTTNQSFDMMITARPNKLNFHLYIDIHLDFVAYFFLMKTLHEWLRRPLQQQQYEAFKLDEPAAISLPLAREHLPTTSTLYVNQQWSTSRCIDTFGEFMLMAPINPYTFAQNNCSVRQNNSHMLMENVIKIDIYDNIETLFCQVAVYNLAIEDDCENDDDQQSNMQYTRPSFFLNHAKFEKNEYFVKCHLNARHYKIDVNILGDYKMLTRNNNNNNNATILDMDENFIPEEFYEIPRTLKLTSPYIFTTNQLCDSNVNNMEFIDSTDTAVLLNIDDELQNYRHFSDATSFPFTRQQCRFLDTCKSSNLTLWMENEQIVYQKLFQHLNGLNKGFSSILYILYTNTCVDELFHMTDNEEEDQQLQQFIEILNKIISSMDTGNESGGGGKKRKISVPPPEESVVSNNTVLAIMDYQQHYQWLKKCIIFIINTGCVTSSVALFYNLNIFKNFRDCIKFLLCTMAKNLTLHAQYIMSRWAMLWPMPIKFFSTSFHHTDLLYCLLQYCDLSEIKAKTKYMSENEMKDLRSLYQTFEQVLTKYDIIPHSTYFKDFFFKFVVNLQVIGSKRNIIFYRRQYHLIGDSELKISFGYSIVGGIAYSIDMAEMNFCTFNRDIGLFNPIFNVYEFAGPATKSLVGIQIRPEITNLLSVTQASFTCMPTLQRKIFELHAKTRHFLKTCRENVVNIVMLCPIIVQQQQQQQSSISYIDDSFIVLLNDFNDVYGPPGGEKNQYWNDDIRNKLIHNSNNQFLHLTHLLKRLTIIFFLLKQNFNYNFAIFSPFIQTIFGKELYEYLGMPYNFDKLNENVATTTLSRADDDDDADTTTEMMDIDNVDNNDADDDDYISQCYQPNLNKTTAFFNALIRGAKKREREILVEKREILQRVIFTTMEPSSTTTTTNTTIATTDDEMNVYVCNFSDVLKTKEIILNIRQNIHESYFTSKDLLELLLNFDDVIIETSRYTDEFFPLVQLEKLSTEMMHFLLLTSSWFIRMGTHHVYRNTRLFQWIHNNAAVLYQELHTLLNTTIGPILKFTTLSELANLLETFCVNTELEPIPSSMSSTLQPELYILNEAVYPPLTDLRTEFPHYFHISDYEARIDGEMARQHLRWIYEAMALMIMFCDFNYDTIEDNLKFIISLLFKGNIQRSCAYWFGVTESCKSRMAEKLDNLVETDEVKTFNAANLSKQVTQDHDAVVVPGARNTLLIFDEIDKVNITRFKTLINTAKMSTRDILGNDSINLKLASKVLLTSNKTFSADHATCARLKPIEKKFRFTPVMGRGVTLNRHDNVNETIACPAQIGAMLLTHKVPAWQDGTEFVGLWLLQHYALPMYVQGCTMPISGRNSQTMQHQMRLYMINNYPVSNFLYTAHIDTSTEFIDDKQFYDIVNQWWSLNKDKFRYSDFDAQSLTRELSNCLSKYRSRRKQKRGFNIKISFDS
nr:hypothetical protein [Microctonus hyperodae filamentous virus]